jgi:outer membrane receptor protein involved in Fe transport
MRQALVLLFTALALFQTATAQKGKITGKLLGDGDLPLENATLSLTKASDSIPLKFAVSSKSGDFIFDQIVNGNYRVRVSAMGYSERNSNVIEITDAEHTVELGIMKLAVSADKTQLQAVTVTAKRPLFEVKPDKTVVNVDAAVTNVGATALEVLEKSPGITIDRDGNISLKGRAGVMVMIDGKPSYLSGTELTNLLQSMTANQIDQIELMTNPPAKYDAAGNAGAINIRTKKCKQRGFNGNVNLGYGQGQYYKTTNSMALNYRNNKFSAFMNYSMNSNPGYGTLNIDRTYFDNAGNVTGYVQQPTNMIFQPFNNTLKVGMDYAITKKTTIGITGNGFINKGEFNGNSIGYPKDVNGIWDTAVHTISQNNNHWTNGSVNVNFRHQIDKDRELTADVDYLQYVSDNAQSFKNTSITPDNANAGITELMGLLPSVINIYSVKTDYTHTFKDGLKMDAGLKSSLVNTNSEANYFNLEGEYWIIDYDKTNHFIYEENINAVYLNMQKKMGKFNAQAGLRYEHTNYKGNQLGNPQKEDSVFTRNYGSLFPTAYITYEADSSNTFSINAGRRINRPAYQMLNPFMFFINQYTYQEGNPFLLPEFTWSVELGHTFKNWLTTTLGYAYTDQRFSQVFRTQGDVTILTFGNIGTRQNISLSVNAQLKPAKWWSANVQLTGAHSAVNGTWMDQQIDTKAYNGQVNINNQFKFKKGWSAELSGFYNSKSIDGQFAIQPFGQVAAGVSKNVLNDKGSVRLNVRDIFFTQIIDGEISYQNVLEHFRQSRDSRVMNVSFTYRFGKTFKDNARRKNGGSATEEQQRVGVN